jgi:hypothetical protein
MNEFVIGGLVKRRAELAGEIEATHERLRKLVMDLEALDATILQFDPSYSVETIAPKAFRPPKDRSNRGQMTRLILSILRQAKEPLTTRDIALQLLVERVLDKNNVRLLRLMTKRVGVALGGQQDNGIVPAEQGPDMLFRLLLTRFVLQRTCGLIDDERRGTLSCAGADHFRPSGNTGSPEVVSWLTSSSCCPQAPPARRRCRSTTSKTTTASRASSSWS